MESSIACFSHFSNANTRFLFLEGKMAKNVLFYLDCGSCRLAANSGEGKLS